MNNNEPQRPDWSARSPGSRLFFAGFLILAGTLLFLGNLGFLPVRDIWLYWPLVIVALGVSRIMQGPDLAVRLFGALFAFIGALVLLINLDVLHVRHDGTAYIAILFMAVGIAMLIKALDKRDRSFSPNWLSFTSLHIADQADDFTVMGSLKRRLDNNEDVNGRKVLCLLGQIDLDLRHAHVANPSQTIYLDASTMLGQVKIRVPDTWRIQIRGASILGNYEDKTVPSNAVDSPTLVITGYSFMGTVEIED